MLSAPQEIGLASILWTCITFAPVGLAVGSKFRARRKKVSPLKREMYCHAGYHINLYVALGLVMYVFLSAAITTYWWSMNPDDLSSPLSNELYLWTVGAYVVLCLCKTMSMWSIVQCRDLSLALLKAWVVFLISCFLVASAAYSTHQYNGDRYGDIVFPLTVFAIHTLWAMWFTWFVYKLRRLTNKYHDNVNVRNTYATSPPPSRGCDGATLPRKTSRSCSSSS